MTDAEADGMADEVCRRWNAYPQMLEALKAAEGHLTETLADKRWHPIGQCPVLDQVRIALAECESLITDAPAVSPFPDTTPEEVAVVAAALNNNLGNILRPQVAENAAYAVILALRHLYRERQS